LIKILSKGQQKENFDQTKRAKQQADPRPNARAGRDATRAAITGSAAGILFGNITHNANFTDCWQFSCPIHFTIWARFFKMELIFTKVTTLRCFFTENQTFHRLDFARKFVKLKK
jgi:hypothetical protein